MVIASAVSLVPSGRSLAATTTFTVIGDADGPPPLDEPPG
jgi:hypothetical protein